MKKAQLREIIMDAMETDGGYGRSDENRILRIFNNLDETQKSTVDDIFISLTGFGLSTHIEVFSNKKENQDDV
jgi:hypothetical protein